VAGPGAEPAGALVILGEPPATDFERLATRIVAILALELDRGGLVHRPRLPTVALRPAGDVHRGWS
jgi:hypothetical protein